MIKAGVLDMKSCVEVMDDVFKLMSKEDYLMGGPKENSHGMKLWFPKEKRTENMPVAGIDRRFMSMIAYVGGDYNVCGDKWYGSNIENKDKNLPRSILNITLNDPDTGAPIAFCSANLVSAMRTGAVPGVGTKYLQAEGASTIGIIGAGVMNRASLMAICETLKDKKVAKVYNRTKSKAEAFCEELRGTLGIDLIAVDTLEEAVIDCDIVSIATSGKYPAKIEDEWIKDGAVIHLVGTANLSEECYLNNKVVVDNWKMHLDWVENGLRHSDGVESLMSSAPSAPLLKLFLSEKKLEKDICSLGDIILGKACGRKDNKEKIIFVTGGVPAEDVAWAHTVYMRAKQMGIGQNLLLWDEPHWS